MLSTHSDKQNAHIRLKTFNVVNNLLKDGFHIIITKTEEIQKERDVAIIDDSIAMEAKVPTDESTKSPKDEIDKTTCFFNTNKEFEDIKWYIDGLLRKEGNNKFAPTSYKTDDLVKIFLS